MDRKRPQPASAQPLPSDEVNRLLVESEALARTAKRTNKSLRGNNAYADRFHAAQTQVMRLFRGMQSAAMPTAQPALVRTITDIEKELGYFFDPRTSEIDRRDLRRHIDVLLKSEVETAISSLRALDTEFVPLEIVNGTRGYVVNVARQVNGSFQIECFDACGVMIRRLIETLIVEVFEKKGLEKEIKDASGNYLMFTDLVNKLISTAGTPVGRTTRKELPTIAIVLNNCAHNRTFNISKPQLVNYQAAIVITVQELIGLWDIRKS
jgi:hypothetical protein